VPRCRVLRMEQFYKLIAPDMTAVDTVIRQSLHSDVALVRQVAEYIVHSGGKRLRPALVLLSAGALGYRGTDHHRTCGSDRVHPHRNPAAR
jgi:octaprenyl-diphosphate synthase